MEDILELKETLDAVCRHYWWHDIRKDVEETIKDCSECNTRGSGRGREKVISPTC